MQSLASKEVNCLRTEKIINYLNNLRLHSLMNKEEGG